MGERTQYTPGTFSWTDLTTPDQDGSKAFYTALFGWEAQDIPMGDDGVYSMMQINGRNIAAISPQPPQQRDAGAPPMWNSYITVDSADDALTRASELGGTVHAPAFDVFDAGRMGVVQDPQGAYFEVWQPKDNIGAGFVNGHGALSWNELATTDIDAGAKFYGDLFGWTAADVDMGEQAYKVVSVGERGNGGIRDVMPPGTPPHWLVYFGIDDIDAGVAKVSEHGGTVMLEPIEIMGGNRIAIVSDPQGAAFGLYAGHFED
jgi:hypothetical protein